MNESLLADLGYRVEKRLRLGPRASVYFATRERDQQPVVLKCYKLPPSDSLSAVRREFQILQALGGNGILRAVDLIESAPLPMLVLERAPGESLSAWAKSRVLSCDDFLTLATQLAEMIGRVHEAKILHGDIHPGNIVVEPGTLCVHLVDFGSARPMFRKEERSCPSSGPLGSAGTLHFVAPEQTGRMDRSADARSDLYGLGATLYFAATSRPPFPYDDALALIHAHMARMPPDPREHRPDLPVTLSRIILRLLQKEPEDRYQTARALHRDLVECREQLRRTGRIDDDLRLGTAEAPVRPLFSQRVYGRARELGALLGIYERAVAGRVQWVCLAGQAGSGKSALVGELRRPVAERGGYFTSGKFDRYQRDVPYSAWIGALDSLVQQILTESEERLLQWKEELLSGLGSIGSVLVELVPDLGAIVGELPVAPEVGPREAQIRLSVAVERFLRSFSTSDRSLVLFLDDLQWADSGSRQLLESLIDLDECSLLIVGAYRESEVDSSHPLASLIEQLRASGHSPVELRVGELTQEAVLSMLSDGLGKPPEAVAGIAETASHRTGNSPLLVQQFVSHLVGLGLLRFEAPGGWTWSDASIASAPVPEGALPMLTAKLRQIETSAQELLQIASCVGHQFDFTDLSELSAMGESEIEQALSELIDEGLVCTSPHRGFRFIHDRVREAAQTSLSDDRRRTLHRHIARTLHGQAILNVPADRAFELADHWNAAGGTLSEDERQYAAVANRVAASRALRSGALETANGYFDAVFEHRQSSGAEASASEIHDLLREAARVAFLMGESARALGLLDRALAVPTEFEERIRTQAERIRILTTVDADASVDLALKTLRELGLRFPRNPSPLRVLASVLYTAWLIGDGTERNFRAQAEEPRLELRREVMTAASGALIAGGPLLTALVLNCGLRMERRLPTHDGIGMLFSAFAHAWISIGGSWKRFQRCVEASKYWIDSVPSPRHERARYAVQAFSLCLTEPRGVLADSLRRTADRLRELGDLEYSGYAELSRTHFLLLRGATLTSLELAPKPPLPDMFSAYRFLTKKNVGDVDWAREFAAEDEKASALGMATQMAIRVHWVVVLSIWGEVDQAWNAIEKTRKEDGGAAAGGFLVELHAFRGVCAAERLRSGRRRDRRRGLRDLRRGMRIARVWATRNPDCAHWMALLEAEEAALRASATTALRLYTRCAERSSAEGMLHVAAFAHERRGTFLERRGRLFEAARAWKQAAVLYGRWGAHAKVMQIKARREPLAR